MALKAMNHVAGRFFKTHFNLVSLKVIITLPIPLILIILAFPQVTCLSHGLIELNNPFYI
jgi:hypothetical protein